MITELNRNMNLKCYLLASVRCRVDKAGQSGINFASCIFVERPHTQHLILFTSIIFCLLFSSGVLTIQTGSVLLCFISFAA